MKYSIIVVTLNPGDKLKDTINSICAQTFGDYEILVKDGGSKDGSLKAKTKELIDEINSDYIPDKRRGYINLDNKDMRIWVSMGTALIEGIVLVSTMFRTDVISALFLIPFIYIGINILVDPVRKNKIPTLVFGTFWSIAIFNMLTGIVRTPAGNIALVLAVIAIAISYLLDINKKIDIKYFREKQVLSRFMKLFGNRRKEENLQFSHMNPKRFYVVLPCVCALNKQDKWVEMHKDIEIEKPDWIETSIMDRGLSAKSCSA